MLGGVHQRCDRLVARAQSLAVAQRAMQPAAQHAAAHGGRRAVENAGKSQLRFSRQAFVELEVASRRRVHDESGIALLGGDGQQMRQRRFLRFADIGEQSAGCRNGQRLVGAAETGEVARAELFGESAGRGFGVEMPGRAQAPGPVLES